MERKIGKLTQLSAAVIRSAVIIAVFFILLILTQAGNVYAGTVTYRDTDAEKSNPPELSSTTDDYVIQGGGKDSRQKTNGYFYVPENSGTSSSPVTITLDNVNISQDGEDPGHSFITIGKDSVVLIKLRGSNYIIAGKNNQVGSDDGMAAIHVSKGAALKITSDKGDGSEDGYLRAEGGGTDYGGAGIGTRYNEDCGTIHIAGGKITAYGGRNAAAIGGGRDGDAGDITISGGYVTANGGEYGCGIGSGNHVGVSSNDGGDLRGDICISGGTVKAHGGRGAAGIGSSDEGKFYGDVFISGGSVTAEGGSLAPGIGCGNDASFHGEAEVRITGGIISAKGGVSSAGIGGGCETNNTRIRIDQNSSKELSITAEGGEHGAGIGSSTRDLEYIDITLRGGTVKATGGENGAGIGSGEQTNILYSADAHNIDIRGTGTIVAHGGRNGAGIGAGNDGKTAGHLTISGDSTGTGSRGKAPDGGRGLDITAVASYGRDEGSDGKAAEYENEAAAIGSGKATGAPISISNAVLKTKADCQGADIGGGGYHTDPSGAVSEIIIDNCDITSSSTHKVAPGIGAGYGGTVHNITITNTWYTGGGIGGAPMDWNYTNLNDVHSITIDNSTIHAEWDEENPGKFVGNLLPTDGPLDHGAAGIGSGQYGDMDEITITDSYIYARGYGSGAGIGGGGAGGSNYTMIPVKKIDIGDTHRISISGSDVTAYSGCADLTEYGPVDLWDGYSHYRIELAKFGGGAGIGSGSASSVTNIDIHDCSKVYAKGYKGAGIGGGCGTGVVQSGGADHIILEDIGKLEAYGGEYCAGIGSGGGDGLRTLYGSVVSEIYIARCPDVTVKSGNGAAGIGLGSASKYKSDYPIKGEQPITIIDSNIVATAGPMGAGIGGGFEDRALGIGGENPPLIIKGKCRIDAYGGGFYYYEDGSGSHGGGAGIGGGSAGGCSAIIIDIDEDPEKAAKGSMDDPSASGYYVHAVGGDGAAGIGSGGDLFQTTSPDISSSDSDSVIIRKGAVFAKGGDGYDAAGTHEVMDIYMGPGAGIGGGAGGSKIRYVTINGGFIMAEAGKNVSGDKDAEADDIGTGGNQSNVSGRKKCDELIIRDGTVLADSFSTFEDRCVITGGSVRGIVKDATDGNGSNVYRTTLKMPDNTRTKVDVTTTKTYNDDHIYSDQYRKVYLYLYERDSEENRMGIDSDTAQFADIIAGGTERHYYGWTDTEHSGLIKLEGRSTNVTCEPSDVRYGDDFILSVYDGTVSGGTEWAFSAEGAASLDSSRSNNVSHGVFAQMHADRLGEFRFHASCDSTPDREMYWGTVADYTGTVGKAEPDISITENLTKVYDGEAVTEPTVSTNSSGAVTYEWFDAEGNKLSSPPADAGEYTVCATVAESGLYTEGSASSSFIIIPASVTVAQSAEITEGGISATVTAEVFGLYEAAGIVEFTVIKEDGQQAADMPASADVIKDGDRYIAQFSHDAPSGTYTVIAKFVPDGNGNYYESDESLRTYNKDLQERSITVRKDGELVSGNITAVYGDDTFSLVSEVSESTGNDEWSYTVVHSTGSDYVVNGSSPANAVTVNGNGNTASVGVDHAGTAVICIYVHERGSQQTFSDACTYVTVKVGKKPLNVTSYAYVTNDGSEDEVNSAAYGKLSGISYKLKYDGFAENKNDTAETFTHGYGTLSAVPVAADASVSDDPYPIGTARQGVDVSIGDRNFSDVFFSRDYEIIYTGGSLKVIPATVGITVCDASGIYGGDEPEYSWKLNEDQSEYDGLADWDSADTICIGEPEFVIISARSRRSGGLDYKTLNAGEYNLGISGGEWPNYEVTAANGVLTVQPADLSESGRFTADAPDSTYDGTIHRNTVTVKDAALKDAASDADKVLGEDEYDVIYPDDSRLTHAGTVTAAVRGKGNYTGVMTVSYRIVKAPLEIRTGSADKVYDGKPLTSDELSITGRADGDSISAVTNGTITDAGAVLNAYSLNWGNARESDYSLTEYIGILRVDPASDKQNGIITSGYRGTYDGTGHTVDAEALLEGSAITYSTDGGETWSSEPPVFTDVTEKPAEVRIRAVNGNYEEGTAEVTTEVSIKKAPLTVRTESAARVYDGSPLTAGGSMSGLVADETAELEVTGTQTEIGSSLNTYRIKWTGTAKESNYQVTEELGMLTVTKAEEQPDGGDKGGDDNKDSGSDPDKGGGTNDNKDPDKGENIDGNKDPDKGKDADGSKVPDKEENADGNKDRDKGKNTDISKEPDRGDDPENSGREDDSGVRTGDDAAPVLWTAVFACSMIMLMLIIMIRIGAYIRRKDR